MLKRTLKVPLTKFRPLILSRHPSHACLRARNKSLQTFVFHSVVRLGSTTEVDKKKYTVEINSVESIKKSSNKLLMKRCFIEAGIKTPEMFVKGDLQEWCRERYPIVAKSYFGSKGKGNTLINNATELNTWLNKKNGVTVHSNYIFERYINYAFEYRLHITEAGCFYACRKALKAGIEEKEKWHRHDSTCVWFLETNPQFYKPENWNNIVEHCVKALKQMGADLLCFDVRVQSPLDSTGKKREYRDFTLIESNSAPSMDNGTKELSVCAKSYINEIPKLLIRKANG